MGDWAMDLPFAGANLADTALVQADTVVNKADSASELADTGARKTDTRAVSVIFEAALGDFNALQ
jgi:hypothetical protein